MNDRFGCLPIQSITEEQAVAWRNNLAKRLAESTISKLVKRARQVWKTAERRGIVQANVFAAVKGGSEENEARLCNVSRSTIELVIDACPNAEWRLIVALARYGGLRACELLVLRWSDVNWERKRSTVVSPKTGSRVVPIFPELLPYFEDVDALAGEGQDRVTPSYAPSANLRTQFLRIIAKAGVDPWPKPWQNLRATRETELADQYPIQVVTKWLGNSPRVAQKHYLQVTEEHFARAAEQGGAGGGDANSRKRVNPDETARSCFDNSRETAYFSGSSDEKAPPVFRLCNSLLLDFSDIHRR